MKSSFTIVDDTRQASGSMLIEAVAMKSGGAAAVVTRPRDGKAAPETVQRHDQRAKAVRNAYQLEEKTE